MVRWWMILNLAVLVAVDVAEYRPDLTPAATIGVTVAAAFMGLPMALWVILEDKLT